jgi:large subunit ribosomal protein L29
MKAHEMREMTLDELKLHHGTLIDELVTLRMQLALRQLDNPMRVKVLRRGVARAQTIINEKNRGAKPGETAAAASPAS